MPNSPPPSDFERTARETRMAGYYKYISDPGLYVHRTTETVNVRINDYVGTLSPFPSVAQLVVLGTVQGSTGFVSSDRTYVYSEFTIKIDEVIKSDQTRSGLDRVVGERPGATITFPSGHTTHYITKDEGFPKVGIQYMFFLWRPPTETGDHYMIVTGYEFSSDGTVHPLDNRPPFTTFESKKQESLRAAVLNSMLKKDLP